VTIQICRVQLFGDVGHQIGDVEDGGTQSFFQLIIANNKPWILGVIKMTVIDDRVDGLDELKAGGFRGVLSETLRQSEC
jgi:hypothetical protein